MYKCTKCGPKLLVVHCKVWSPNAVLLKFWCFWVLLITGMMMMHSMIMMRSVGGEGNFGGCCEMMKGPGGDRPAPRSDQTRSQSPQKLILHHFSPPPPPNLTSLVEGQVTGKKDGKADQKKAKRHSFCR